MKTLQGPSTAAYLTDQDLAATFTVGKYLFLERAAYAPITKNRPGKKLGATTVNPLAGVSAFPISFASFLC